MLRLSASLVNQPILSLRLGGRIGVAQEPVIDPHDLKILGWWCKVPGKSTQEILLTEQVRQYSSAGLAVDDTDALAEPEDLVRHKEILEIDFELLNKPVRNKRGHIGRVEDYSYNDGMFVQKLYVGKPLHRVLTSSPTVLIDRSQILEVNDDHILVKDTEVTQGAEEPAPVPALA